MFKALWDAAPPFRVYSFPGALQPVQAGKETQAGVLQESGSWTFQVKSGPGFAGVGKWAEAGPSSLEAERSILKAQGFGKPVDYLGLLPFVTSQFHGAPNYSQPGNG